jgi:cell division protein FtsL
MNRHWQRLHYWLVEYRPRGLMLPMTLAALVIASALWAIAIKHENRSLTGRLEQARTEHGHLQMEWSQLQLEEAALSHHARIESTARQDLGMAEPRNYVIVQTSQLEATK